jgi:hypothetical protein
VGEELPFQDAGFDFLSGFTECGLRELFNGLIRDYRAVNP